MESRARTLVTTGLAGVAILGLLVSRYFGPPAYPGVLQPPVMEGPSVSQVAKDTPVPSLPSTIINERSNARDSRALDVEIQDALGAPAKPLGNGSLVLESAGGSSTYTVVDGRVTVPVSELSTATVCAVLTESQVELHVDPELPPQGRPVRAYAFDCYFLKVSERDGPIETLEAFELAAADPATPRFLYPPEAGRLRSLQIEYPRPNCIVAPSMAATRLMVRARGRAWFDVDLTKLPYGAKLDVELERAGSVIFATVDRSSPSRLYVAIRRASGERVMLAPASDVVNRQHDHWAPGLYTAVLTRGPSYGQESQIGEITTFEVLAGSTCQVDLVVPAEEADSKPARGSLSGRLSVRTFDAIDQWLEAYPLTIELQGTDEATSGSLARSPQSRRQLSSSRMLETSSIGDALRSWSWSFGQVEVGHYRIQVVGLGYSVECEVRASEPTEVTLELPLLAVTVFDLGLPITDVRRLMLTLTSPGVAAAPRGRRTPPAPLIAAEGGQVLTVSLPGNYGVLLLWNGVPYSKQITLVSGWNSCWLPVTAAQSAELHLVDSEGQPMFLTLEEWRAMRITDARGTVASLKPFYASVEGRGGYSAARITEFTEGPYRVEGLEATPWSVATPVIELSDQAIIRLLLNPR